MRMTDFEIRRAIAADLPALAEIQQRSMRELASMSYETAQIAAFLEHGEAILSEIIEKANCWVAVAGPLVIGCAAWCRPGAISLSALPKRPTLPEAEIRSVHVRPGWTRRGVARRLLDRIEKDAAEASVLRLSLLSTLNGRAFYEALGFSATGEKKLKVDGLFMTGVAMTKQLEKSRSAA
ncbi:GNAT family N-acetyltransferase [Hyphococcus luteus]|uniref:N-acetyltransferase domain-containing protein n=1 Tax=Hyphococcus luteus TaxID=2058213 RepID=A0A2S7JZJ4_9PROT|nr:GNAT family N-acetyltransferase [Marinicaulis flavus]PQA85652.1 hypothetical protein CW354_22240 [Marinicaulis flavus]